MRGEGGGAVDPWEKSEGRERWAAAHEIEGKGRAVEVGTRVKSLARYPARCDLKF